MFVNGWIRKCCRFIAVNVQLILCPLEATADGLPEEIISSLDESSPLVDQSTQQSRAAVNQTDRSLTADYDDVIFEHSPTALKLCFAYMALYVVVSILAYPFCFEPDWTIIDAIYFAVCTLTTVGYGDLYPTTEGGRLFTIFFALYGVVILGVFLGIIGQAIGDFQSKAAETLEKENSTRLMRKFRQQTESTIIPVSSQPTKATLHQEIGSMMWMESPVLAVVIIMAFIVGIVQKWSWIESLHFCVVSFTTIGYGDMVPTTQGTRLWCSLFLPVAVGLFGEILVRISSLYSKRRNQTVEDKFLDRSLTLCDLQMMDKDQNGRVDREEFLCFMLVTLQKVDQEDIDEIRDLFSRFDKKNRGYLDRDDLKRQTKGSLAKKNTV